MFSFPNDLRFVTRNLLSRPGFTIVAVVSLALGIGANTAIFSVVDSALLRPLPFRNSDQLVHIEDHQPAYPDSTLSPGEFLDYQRQAKDFSGLAALSSQSFTLTSASDPKPIVGRIVTPNFFAVLGAVPERGRIFSEHIDRPNAESREAVISDGLWRSTFAADPNIVGRDITLNDKAFKVVGILAPRLEYPQNTQVWVTPRTAVPEYFEIGPPAANITQQYGTHWLGAIGRVKAGVSLAQAQSELRTIGDRIHRNQHTDELHFAQASPLRGYMVERVKPAILVLFVAVFALLLIGCANVSGLLLARATGRARELSIRLALGATRWRIVGLVLLESAVVTGMGAGLAFVVASGALRLMELYSPYDLPPALAPQLNTPVLLFCIGISCVAALLTGIVPGLQASRVDVQSNLKESSKGSASGRAVLIRRVLVMAEISLSVVLLVGALLLIRSFVSILAVNPGFSAEHIVTAQIALPGKRYPTNASAVAFWDSLQQSAATIPGVESAAISRFLPEGNSNMGGDFEIPGRTDPKAKERPYADFFIVGPHLFQALRIPLIAGREFSGLDGEHSQKVVIINRSFADRYFPHENPIGRQIRYGSGSDDPLMTVVGIVGNVKWHKLDEKDESIDLYFPYTQFSPILNSTLVLRTQPGFSVTVHQLHQILQSIDPEIPISDFQSLAVSVDKSLGQRRFLLGLMAIFTATAILLAAVGLYALLSFTVGQRRQEIGIRVAIGASRADVVWMVLRDSLAIAAFGLLVGLTAAFWCTSLMQSLLFGITGNDLPSYAAATGLIVLITVAAASVPALKAAYTDPAIALRYE